jgi:hypothetical protein
MKETESSLRILIGDGEKVVKFSDGKKIMK